MYQCVTYCKTVYINFIAGFYLFIRTHFKKKYVLTTLSPVCLLLPPNMCVFYFKDIFNFFMNSGDFTIKTALSMLCRNKKAVPL